MNKTKIEWLNGGYTWNPVTGCLHNCEYCYARKFAKRFGSGLSKDDGASLVCLEERQKIKGKYISLPYDFNPTFHKYRLDEPQKCKKPQNIFVCSMADLFGDWVPDKWIKAVFDACEKAPQHRYLFLTKNPNRYKDLHRKEILSDKFWFGITITKPLHLEMLPFIIGEYNFFLSYEPIEEPIRDFPINFKWLILGAETGNRKNKVIPKLEWLESIVKFCENRNIPIFMKDSLKGIWGKELIQQYPWEVENAKPN